MDKNKNAWTAITAVIFGIVGFIMMVLKVSERTEDVAPIDIHEDGQVDFRITFGGGARYINTDKFEKAYFRCRFGGMEVYFDEAELHEGKGVIDIDASFGAVELYIPKAWRVENNLKVLFGSVEYKNEEQEEPDKVVTLTGSISCGAVEIIYV